MPYHQLIGKAADAGFGVWSLWDPRAPGADLLPEVAAASRELLHAGFTDPAGLRSLVARTVRRHGIGTVLHCGGGPSLLPIAEEAWRLGLSPNPPDVFRRLRSAGDAGAPGPRLTVQTLTVDGCHQVVGTAAHRVSGPPGRTLTGYLCPHRSPAGRRRRSGRSSAGCCTRADTASAPPTPRWPWLPRAHGWCAAVPGSGPTASPC